MKPRETKSEPNSLQKRKLMRRSTLISLTGIAIAAAATIYVVSQSPSIKSHYKSAIKPGSDPKLIIRAFSKSSDGKYNEINSQPLEGGKLIFKASTVMPVHLALLKSSNNSAPTIVFNVLIPPGENKLLEKAGIKYIYTIHKQDKALRFCLMYAESRNQLLQRIKALDIIWPTIPEAACLELSPRPI